MEPRQPARLRSSLQSLINEAILTIDDDESSQSVLATAEDSRDGIRDAEAKDDIPDDELEGNNAAGGEEWERRKEKFKD
jgi:hypothetical protein